MINTENWLHVRALNVEEAVSYEPGRWRKIGRGGMIVTGLEPK